MLPQVFSASAFCPETQPCEGGGVHRRSAGDCMEKDRGVPCTRNMNGRLAAVSALAHICLLCIKPFLLGNLSASVKCERAGQGTMDSPKSFLCYAMLKYAISSAARNYP